MAMLEYLLHAYRLKDQPRKGWLLRGVEDPESVADHSWGTALLCLLFAERAGVDRAEALEIALLHDLAEAEIGDIPNRQDARDHDVDREEKARLEARAMTALEERWPGGPARRVVERWRTYEDRAGDAARFVRDMNLLDMCLQALMYERDVRYDPRADMPVFSQHPHLDEFFASAEARIETELGHELFAQVRARYEEVRATAAENA